MHIIDLLTLGYLAFEAYRGYTKAAIIQALELFALMMSLFLVFFFTEQIYLMLSYQGFNIAELIAALFLLTGTVASMWFANVIYLLTSKKLAEITKTYKERIIGLMLGMVKAILILGVFMVVVKEVDAYTNFLPPAEKIAPENSKKKSILGTANYIIITTVSPALKFEAHKPDRKPKIHEKYIEPKSTDFYDDDF